MRLSIAKEEIYDKKSFIKKLWSTEAERLLPLVIHFDEVATWRLFLLPIGLERRWERWRREAGSRSRLH